jgi:hypothetical protein
MRLRILVKSKAKAICAAIENCLARPSEPLHASLEQRGLIPLRLNQLSAFDDPTVYDQFCTSNRLPIDLKLRVGDWNARSIELLLTFLVLVAEEVI